MKDRIKKYIDDKIYNYVESNDDLYRSLVKDYAKGKNIYKQLIIKDNVIGKLNIENCILLDGIIMTYNRHYNDVINANDLDINENGVNVIERK